MGAQGSTCAMQGGHVPEPSAEPFGEPSVVPSIAPRDANGLGVIEARVAAMARYDAFANADDPTVGKALRESLSERAHEVRPRLWLGAHAATEPFFLEALGVTHVLNCLDATAVADADVVTLTLNLEDVESQRVPLARATAFIRCALDAGGVVLVHCAAGISRSATCVAAHIVATERCSVEAALTSVRAVRAQASPNEGFLAQLCAFRRSRSARRLPPRPRSARRTRRTLQRSRPRAARGDRGPWAARVRRPCSAMIMMEQTGVGIRAALRQIWYNKIRALA